MGDPSIEKFDSQLVDPATTRSIHLHGSTRVMKYMLLTYLDEKKWLALTDEQQRADMEKCEPHVQRLASSGKLLGGSPLHPVSTATTVRAHAGKRIVTDGPFAETREQLGGYTIVEAKDLDEAIDIAAGFLGDDSLASIEVRPILDLADVPGSERFADHVRAV